MCVRCGEWVVVEYLVGAQESVLDVEDGEDVLDVRTRVLHVGR
jgi:hypothetical protein